LDVLEEGIGDGDGSVPGSFFTLRRILGLDGNFMMQDNLVEAFEELLGL